MQIKVYCPCSAKFSFEVEPRDGRMPVRIACPTCGQDATELANQEIQRQLAPAEMTPTASGAHASKSTIRVRVAAPASEVVEQDTDPQPDGASVQEGTCLKHVGRRIVETCRVCGKPICRKCMARYGYVCSVFCQNKADAEGLELPVYARQRSVIQRKAQNRTRALMAAAASVLLFLVAGLVYYKAYASKPHIVHAHAIQLGEFESGWSRLLDDKTYLTLVGQKLSLYADSSDSPTWTTSFAEDGDEESTFSYGGGIELLDHKDDLWMRSGNRVVCCDRNTGEWKHQHTIAGYVEQQRVHQDGVTFVSVSGGGLQAPDRIVTLILFADGRETTFPVRDPEEAIRTNPVKDSQAVTRSYVNAGPNLVEMQVKLLEERTVVREAIKTPKKSLVDSGKVSGANAFQAAEELLNEISRTTTGGKEYEDASLYEVTLHRHMDTNAPDWTGQVTGQVSFYAMNNLDLLVAGKSLRVLNKQNKLLWEAPLTYPVPTMFQSPFGHPAAPALESGNTLYFFDQGMLTAFDVSTGNARWRVISVGVRDVQEDPHGDLYVCTSTANAEDIQYSQQIKVLDKIRGVLMKVDGENGKVLWKTTLAGDDCVLSGDYVYSTKARLDITAAINPENDETHFRIYRINPKTGERMWTYYRPLEPLSVDFRENTLLLQFPDEVQLLRYLSL